MRFPWHRIDPKLPEAEYNAAALEKLRGRCKRLPNGCLEFLGTKSTNGYGQFQYRGKAVPAHILVYRLCKGPIPEGFDVAHGCDHPPCCEETHLSLKTHGDNIRESVARGRHPLAAQTHCKRGHELAGDNLYVHKGSRHCKACERGKQRIYAGWPADLAYSTPKNQGHYPKDLVRVTPPKNREYNASHCPSGHEMAGANVYVSPDGYRKCRRCRTNATLRWKPKPPSYAHNPSSEQPK